MRVVILEHVSTDTQMLRNIKFGITGLRLMTLMVINLSHSAIKRN